MSVTLTFPGRPLERYREFDIYPGQFGRHWQALHKDADDADDYRVMWAKNREELLAEVDRWHWERTAEPLVNILEDIMRPYGMYDVAVSGNCHRESVDEFLAFGRKIKAAIANARGEA
ncbi:hypothetical protein [Sphingomonas sp.]|uniref:hypothetical protein n=1 Tax=Sphingomonas sp. TaxID=28214 RepID=UPI003B3B160C